MPDPGFFAKGAIVGFSIAAPVGPIGLLCIRRTLAAGLRRGLATGLGAAAADCVYGCVAGFGLTAVSSFLVGLRLILGVVGGLSLCWLGLRTFLAPPAERPAAGQGTGIASAFLSTFVLTLTNPMTILSFVAVFSGLGLADASGRSGAVALIAGVFAGSAAWWLLLGGAVSVFRTSIGPRWLVAINRGSGALLFAFGVYGMATGLRG
jgi:threonine/homoserine/homoserine lactone efflux protein